MYFSQQYVKCYLCLFQAVRSTQSLEVPLVHKGELMVSYKVVKVKFFEAEPLILFATFIAEDRGLLKLKVIEYVALCLDIFKVHYTRWPVF